MLELRPNCEHCAKLLPADSLEAMICSFECTFCTECVDEILKNVCPNCGGGFEKRPIRPSALLESYPTSFDMIHNPVDIQKFNIMLRKFQDLSPDKR